MKIIDISILIFLILYFVRSWLYHNYKNGYVPFVSFLKEFVQLKVDILLNFFDLRFIIKKGSNHYTLNLITFILYLFMLFYCAYAIFS